MVNVEQDRDSDKESVTALPVVSSPTAARKEPSRLRHGSGSGSASNMPPTLKKRSSFSALRKLFSRLSGSAEPGGARARMEDGKGEDGSPVLAAKKKTPVLENLIELPG
jgi:hypothetical protein